MATHFVPTEEIQKLTLGSYEYLATKIDEAIAKDAKLIFGESVPNKVERIGTFGEHVLVAADDGRFMKVKYEMAGGAVKFAGSSKLDVPLYTEENLGKYLMQEARTIVDSLLAHDGTQADLRIRSLLPFVEESQPPTEEEVVASIIENIRGDRPWKRLYRERSAQVREFLGEALKGIEARKLPTKYESRAFDPITPELAQLVHTDLAYMAEAVGNWAKLVEAAGDLKDAQAQATNPEDLAKVTTFVAFSEDLKRDLQNVRESVLESLKVVNSVSSLGKVYDTLAEESFHYEIASQFASTMIEGLRTSK